jgi:hypothetical protein
MGKVKKKVNLGVLGVSPYVSKGVPWSCLNLVVGKQCAKWWKQHEEDVL